jgi:hypothetical protein
VEESSVSLLPVCPRTLCLDQFICVPLATARELLEHVLGEHTTTATEFRAIIYELQKGVLSLLADERDIADVDHYLAAVTFRFDPFPRRP